jgi:hypothetical protein
MNLKKYFLAFLMTIFVLNVIGQGQPGDGGGGTGGPGGPIDPGSGDPAPAGGGVPFEGLGILLVAGASFGAKKVYDYRKKSRGDHETKSPND